MDNSADKKDEPPSQKKEISSNFQKICLVCGDKALGYNFNAISCESCKAFFRRNALASKEFKCPFTNNCAITVVTRRFCQKCRLEKCLAIGMVKEFIMSEEDKAEKRRKIEENRARKRQLCDSETAVTTSSKNPRRDDETVNQSNYTPIQESIVQYDVLNSSTCSPSSTVQSPLSIELETSLHSPPVYNYTQVPPAQNIGQTYPLRVYPIDEKSVINESMYEQRVTDPYVYENVDNNVYTELPKQNSIRLVICLDYNFC